MQLLIVLCSVVACALAEPGVVAGVNSLAYGAPIGLGYSGAYLGYSGAHLGYSGAHLGYSGAHLGYAASPLGYAASPLGYSAAHYAVAAPALRTQYHAQDELGQASYGHAEAYQTHNAVQDAAGNKIGSFSYISPEGSVIKTDYVADGLGYRVASNALPVGPSALPVPVVDTPEVQAARAAHLAEHVAVKSRVRRGIAAVGHLPASTAPLAAPLAYSHGIAAYSHGIAAPVAYSHGIAAPVAYSHGIAAPVAYSHGIAAPVAYSHGIAAPVSYSHGIAAPLAYSHAIPAVRAATLTTVVNNPGHAVSYRVD